MSAMVKERARASTSVSTDRSHAPAWERSPGRSGVRLRQTLKDDYTAAQLSEALSRGRCAATVRTDLDR